MVGVKNLPAGMAAISLDNSKRKTPNGSALEPQDTPPRLDERFGKLKSEIIPSAQQETVSASYARLKLALEAEAERISQAQQSAIPEVAWSDVLSNGNTIPSSVADQARRAGCIILRKVVSPEQALAWKEELRQYTVAHPGMGGKPRSSPTFWLCYHTRPQVQARSHPSVLKAMNAISQLWHVDDESLPIDLSSQVVYADRFRIRHPGDREFSLPPHLDSSAIERWEDPIYRSNYAKVFEGRWEEYDPWRVDARPYARTDLYAGPGACSAFRAMQGWLSLSTCGPGEGTLRLLPSLQLSSAYLLLRPFFVDEGDEAFDNTQPTFPGSTPGRGQMFPTRQWHPHLQLHRTVVSVPRVEPGDYVFWHADLVHEVESQHNGQLDSSVMYNANMPLCPYNIQNMLRMRQAFRDVVPPGDFVNDCGGPFEVEREHADHGAREENILTIEGRRALGLAPFDAEEEGLTEGQRLARRMANEAMREK